MTEQAPLDFTDSEMETLSLDAFNSKHRWKKILRKGMLIPVDDAFSQIQQGRVREVWGSVTIHPSRHELAVYMQKIVDHKNEQLAKLVESKNKRLTEIAKPPSPETVEEMKKVKYDELIESLDDAASCTVSGELKVTTDGPPPDYNVDGLVPIEITEINSTEGSITVEADNQLGDTVILGRGRPKESEDE